MNCTSYGQHSPEVGCCFVVLLLRLIAPAVTSRPAPVLLKLLPLRCLPVCPAPPPPRFLAVGGYDNTVRMLSLEDGTQLRPVATQAVNVSGGLSWTHQQRLSRSSCAACGSSSKQPWR